MAQIPKPVKTFIKIVMSLAFFMVLLSFVKGNELLSVFEQVSYPFLALSVAITFILVVASCMKWKIILDLKEQLPFWELLKIYFVGYFFSNILPSTVGGDVVRSFYAGKLINNQSYSAVSVFVERFSGILFLFILVAIMPFLQVKLLSNPYIFVPACAGLFFVSVTFVIWRVKNPFAIPNRIANALFRNLRNIAEKLSSPLLQSAVVRLEKIYEKIIQRLKKLREEMKVAVQAIKKDKTFLWRLIILTVFFYILTWVNVYVSYLAFDVEVNFVEICAIVPAIMLVAHVPVTLLGNLGYFESVFVFYFLFVGVGGAESLAMGLLLRAKMLLMGAIGFVTYLVYKQKHKLKLQGE